MNGDVKINIGGGHKRYPGFLNVDIDINTGADITADLERDFLPFPDSSVSEVKAYHVLEHLGDGFFHCMQELYRVCKHGAIIDIQVPHPRHEYFLNDPTHKRPIMPEGMRLFSKKFNQRNIELGGAASNLGIRFNVDFELVWVEYLFDEYYREILQSGNQVELNRLGREVNNFATEIHMKLVVVKDA